jgi:signal transduction histidine kinase
LNNVLKHAKAQTVNIRLIKGNRNLSLTIVDDGTGFDRKTKREGIGITNMMSRAEHMGGSFKIETAPGEGCSVLVNFKTP